LWIEKASTASNIDIPYRFTGKERDEETGLYYYGARYLDSKASRWLSADPALGDYIPGAPVDDEARKRNQSLPGMGGVFNTVNLHLYHYAGNNPVKYTDPDGNIIRLLPTMRAPQIRIEVQRGAGDAPFNDTFRIYNSSGDMAYTGIVHAEMSMLPTANNDFTLPEGEYSATLIKTATNFEKSLYVTSKTVISPETGERGISGTGHLVHSNEITRKSVRAKRAAEGKSNGPFLTPQSLGCILFKNKEEFNEMWGVLENLGYKEGDSIKMIIREPAGTE
jgi:RHS repeat-associated protein